MGVGLGLGLGLGLETGVVVVPFLPPRVCTADILVSPMLYPLSAARRLSSFKDDAADSSCAALSKLTVVGTLTVPDSRRLPAEPVTNRATRPYSVTGSMPPTAATTPLAYSTLAPLEKSSGEPYARVAVNSSWKSPAYVRAGGVEVVVGTGVVELVVGAIVVVVLVVGATVVVVLVVGATVVVVLVVGAIVVVVLVVGATVVVVLVVGATVVVVLVVGTTVVVVLVVGATVVVVLVVGATVVVVLVVGATVVVVVVVGARTHTVAFSLTYPASHVHTSVGASAVTGTRRMTTPDPPAPPVAPDPIEPPPPPPPVPGVPEWCVFVP